LAQLLRDLGVNVPFWLDGWVPASQSIVNLSPLSSVIIVSCTIILILGAKESSRFNVVMTIFNVTLIVFIIILGAYYVEKQNYIPFFPNGVNGVLTGAGMVFFSYIGFDSVSTLAAEVKNPTRDMPLGIVGTLVITTVMYIGVSFVVNGMVPFWRVDRSAPIAAAFSTRGVTWAAILVSVGSMTSLTATTLVSLLGQPRIFYQMARDGLLFPQFAYLSNKRQIPLFGTIVTAIFATALALFFDINSLTNMISFGTLLAFSTVCGGIVLLRFKESVEVNNELPSFVSLDRVSRRYSRFNSLEGLARAVRSNIFILKVKFNFLRA